MPPIKWPTPRPLWSVLLWWLNIDSICVYIQHQLNCKPDSMEQWMSIWFGNHIQTLSSSRDLWNWHWPTVSSLHLDNCKAEPIPHTYLWVGDSWALSFSKHQHRKDGFSFWKCGIKTAIPWQQSMGVSFWSHVSNWMQLVSSAAAAAAADAGHASASESSYCSKRCVTTHLD
jgi:hypothetical protein